MAIVRKDIKETESKYFKYVLKSSMFKMLNNKEYSLTLNDICFNIDDQDIYHGNKNKKKDKLEEQEQFIIDFIENDSKKDNEDDINIMYSSLPIFLDDDNIHKMLRFELIAIAELNNKYGQNKYSYIFCNNFECLEFISTSTVRFGRTTEDDI